MPELIKSPTRIMAAGNKPKIIEEFIGRMNNGERRLSVARMCSPEGWAEPGQTPEFDEFTLVTKGTLRVTHRTGVFEAGANEVVVSNAGEWVQYSTPFTGGAEYIAICLPAFSPQTAHRDEEGRQMPTHGSDK
jgi:mannose-6-phosphate isomerase-like protein (cupin superfamily)